MSIIDPDHVMEARRVAVRDGDGQPWRWFGPAVIWTLRNWRTDAPWLVLEDQCIDAAFRYSTHCCRIVSAPSAEALEQVDLRAL